MVFDAQLTQMSSDSRRIGSPWLLRGLVARLGYAVLLGAVVSLCVPQAMAATPSPTSSQTQGAHQASKPATKKANQSKAKPKKASAQRKAKPNKAVAQNKSRPSHRATRVARDPNNRMAPSAKLGLQSALTEAALSSSAVLVLDQISGEVLFEKNPDAVMPIASITKLMTALVVAEADLPMEEMLTINRDDADLEKGVTSRLSVGTRLSRGEFMHLALMSSENRAAHLLGRTYPGGMDAFVKAMNVKALQLGMNESRFVEPTGLNAGNVSTPRDLARLVEEAHSVPLIRDYSTARNLLVKVGHRNQHFINTNALARGDSWELGLSKTGFIREAGRCLVMQAEVETRPVIMIMLDAQGKQQRLRDAERIRRWLVQQASSKPKSAQPQAALPSGSRPS